MAEQTTEPISDEERARLAAEQARMPLREGSLRLVRRGKRPKARARAKREEALSEEEREALDEEERKRLEEEEAAREGEGAGEADDEERELDEEEEGREGDEEVIEIAISSEAEVERYDWWENERYLEVLGHAEGEIDLSYARDGLPLFVGHDEREMVGLVENIRLDADGKLRGDARFSRSARAQEIEDDIRRGIRKKVSVGYDPGETYERTERDGRKVRRYRGWRPLEVSSVPIPADYEVGVGRSARPGVPRPANHPGTAAKAKEHNVSTTPTAAAPAAGAGIDERNKELVALARTHKMEAKLADWISNGASLDQARNEVLEHYQRQSAEVIRTGGGTGPLDFSHDEKKRYSFARAIQSGMNPGVATYEREVSDALYKKLGREQRDAKSILVPTQLLGRAMQMRMQTRTMAVGNTDAGSALKFTEYGGFLELLRNRMYVQQFGATVLSGLQGNLAFVTQPSANTWQWGAETGTQSATDFGTGLKEMSPKDGAALTKYTRRLMAQSVESIEGLVQDDLMRIAALALDAAAIQAGGGSAPVGVLGTTGIGSVTLGTAGAAPTFGTFVDLWTETAKDNADAADAGYLTTPGAAGFLQKTQQFSGTNGVPIWTWRPDGLGMINGHKAAATNQVPNNGTKGSNTGVLHAAVFGDWPSLIIGEWGALELLVDPYSSKMNLIEVGAHLMADVLLRYPEKFSAVTDMVIT